MPRSLIITEKPSVARDVAGALPGTFAKKGDFYESPDWVIGFAIGHLVEQVDPDQYDERYKKWKYEDLPIVPEAFKYQARDAKAGKQLKALHKYMADSDITSIVNACDAGREGELIFKLILETAPKKAHEKPVKRAWFSSMTAHAIREAFEQLRDDAEMIPLEEAARARSEADWLVGMNATRAATTRAGSVRRVLSLGRVQTPTLAIIVNRDLAIQAFVAEDYWEVEAAFATATGARYVGLWHEGSTNRLKAAEPATAIVEAVRDKPAVVESLETKPQVEQSPMLYDLTTLQREANRRFGFSAQRTLSAAQALYDQHKLLTYPRTSSRYLSGDMVAQLKPTAARVGAAAPVYADAARFVLALEKLPLGKVVNDARVTDHHAIIPTDAEHDLSGLSRDEHRIYDLVVMNSTWHWRMYATMLLSREFLGMVRAHMTPEAVMTFNTTGSPDVLATAAAVFPHAYLYDNFAVVGQTDWRERLRTPEAVAALKAVSPGGKPMFGPGDDDLVADFLNPRRVRDLAAVKAAAGRPVEIITDRNLLTEYRYPVR